MFLLHHLVPIVVSSHCCFNRCCDAKANAKLNVSISIKVALFISPYKVFSNDSNGHDFYFLNVIILIF